MSVKQFNTNIVFNSRESKSKYVFDKYRSILDQSVLDVGADAMYLKPLILSNGAKYNGVGRGEGIDHDLDLEKTPFPFENDSFETVLCLDVLEHLESIHLVFDELCRISKKYVVVSLPNPLSDIFSVIRKKDYSSTQCLKFYGLPVDPPEDRHRWFFTEKEARAFVKERGHRNGFSTMQIDAIGEHQKMGGNGLKGAVGRLLFKTIFRNDIDSLNLHHGTIWFVLEKNV